MRLFVIKYRFNFYMGKEPSLSIIIPALNEGPNLTRLAPLLNKPNLEVLIADGGSTDNSQYVAESAGFNFIACPQKGRAAQANFAAQQARACHLFFLHADCTPPPQFAILIGKSLKGTAKAGCFTLRFDWPHWFLKSNAWFTRFNFTAFRFGDQGLFVQKSVWRQIGGYQEKMRLLEDQEVVHRLKKHAKFVVLKQSMLTSARKYRTNGPYKLQFNFYKIWLGYHVGFSQDTLQKMYTKNIVDERH
jgi:rSAM/selenodomain-associated transferase 2